MDEIKERSCACPIGEQEVPCHHIGALLLYAAETLPKVIGPPFYKSILAIGNT